MTLAKLSRLLLTLTVIALPFGAFAQPAGQEAEAKRIGDPYPLATCPVSGEKLGSMGEPVVRVYDGRQVRFCCAGCPAKFESHAEAYWRKIDEAIVKQQEEQYPMDTCLVSGEKLDAEMGEPIDFIHGNRLIRFCCKGCVKDFKAEPEKFLKKLDAAVIEAQKEDYPFETCVVSGEALGGSMGKPIDAVYANRLVRFCCKGCARDFEKAPAQYLEKIDAARKVKAADADATDATPAHGHQGDSSAHKAH